MIEMVIHQRSREHAMNRTLVVLASAAHTDWPRTELEAALGSMVADLYDCFTHDTFELACQLPQVRVEIHPATDGVGALARPAADGLVVVVSADVPHLPIWRLRDAFTLLEDGADLVVGPCEGGSWYLLGLRAPQPDLLRVLPVVGDPLRPILRLARDLGLKAAGLPAWYRLTTPADLDRLSADLRALPTPAAPRTFALLRGADLHARAIGD